MNEIEAKKLKNLVSLLRRKATKELKKVKSDISHYEGMCKGMYIGYEEAANKIAQILRESKGV
jgi:hypothetical protein